MIERQTFRARITLTMTAVVGAAVILLGAVAFITVRVSLDTAFENRLATTAFAIRSVVDIRHGKLQKLDGEDREQFIAVLGGRTNGAVLWADGRLMTSNLAAPPAALVAAIARPGATQGDVDLPSGSVGYVAVPIAERGIRYGTVAAWESHSTYNDAVSTTLAALALAGVIVIAAAAGAGGVLARRMLRPVTDLSAMLADIEAADLTERLNWSGPDDELGRLCRTFDRLLDRLEGAFVRERRFIADASHELRTPVSVIRAEVELALMHERSTEVYRETLERLQHETQRLEVLAESLLLTAFDGTSGDRLEVIEAGDAAKRTADRLQPLARTRGVTLQYRMDAGALIMADFLSLERAITAVIENALRFSRMDGTIDIAVSSDDTLTSITIRDDGPGFSERALSEATRRFWREDESRSDAGAGLGLSIARSIVERWNGSIILANAPNGSGAIVTLALPSFIELS